MASTTGYGHSPYASYGKNADAKYAPNFDTYINFSAITPPVQKHLQKVYLTLAASLLFVVLGAYVHLSLNLGSFLTFAGSMICVIGIASTPASPDKERFRLGLLAGAAFFQGCSMGPLLETVAGIDSSLISSAFLATSAIFASFSAAALLARRREYLYLGGLLSSALSMLLALRLASFLFGTHVLQFQLELYFGLFVVAGYVIFDTQMMVEKASLGASDYIHDALHLLIDFVGTFVRILIILARNSGKNEEGRERRSSNKRR